MSFKRLMDMDGYQSVITTLENKISDLDRFIEYTEAFLHKVDESKIEFEEEEECKNLLDMFYENKKQINSFLVWLSPDERTFYDIGTINDLRDMEEYKKLIDACDHLWEFYENAITSLVELESEIEKDNEYYNQIAKIDKERIARYLPDFDEEENLEKLRELERQEADSYYVSRKFGRLEVGIESAIYDMDAWLSHLENQEILQKRLEWVEEYRRELKRLNIQDIIFFRRRGFFPMSWDINPPTLPCYSVTHIQIPTDIIEEALNFRLKKSPPISSFDEVYDLNFRYVMCDLFDLESYICYRYQTKIELLIERIASWIDENIESNIYEDGQYITQQAGELYEKIFRMDESDFLDYKRLTSLVNCVDELAYSICMYYGFNFEIVKEDIGYAVPNAIDYLREIRFDLSDDFEETYEEQDINVEENEEENEIEYIYDDEYPFFELTGLKVVNYLNYIILSMNLFFGSDAKDNSVVIPVSITTKSIESNTSNSFNQVHKLSDGKKHLSSFLIMNAKEKSDLCGNDIELAYYTSELRLCTAIYKCDIYGNFIFMDWKNRTMTSKEIEDYNNRLIADC